MSQEENSELDLELSDLSSTYQDYMWLKNEISKIGTQSSFCYKINQDFAALSL